MGNIKQAKIEITESEDSFEEEIMDSELAMDDDSEMGDNETQNKNDSTGEITYQNEYLYTATIKIWGKLTTATGATALEALAMLKSEAKKGVGILTVSKGETSKTKVLNTGQTFRLFSGSRIGREIALKNVGMIFKDM